MVNQLGAKYLSLKVRIESRNSYRYTISLFKQYFNLELMNLPVCLDCYALNILQVMKLANESVFFSVTCKDKEGFSLKTYCCNE